MSYAQAIVDMLKADLELKHLLTGGIYKIGDPGRKGLNRLQLGDAFNDQTGLLKPVGIVAEADEEADGQAVDPTTAYRTTQTQIWIRVLDHGDNGWKTIAEAEPHIMRLLDCKQIPGAFQAFWRKTYKDRRDPNLRDACYYQFVFDVQGYRQAR